MFNRRGYTMIEVLVIFAIAAILISILWGAARKGAGNCTRNGQSVSCLQVGTPDTCTRNDVQVPCRQ